MASAEMDHGSRFAYVCNQCGLCCRDKVITLSPYDVIRIARVVQITTGEAVARYTLRRGSILRFAPDGGCLALEGARCTIHRGRPLACRLYPLGLERGSGDKFVKLEAAIGSLGIYGGWGTVEEFLNAQDVDVYLAMNTRYATLIPRLRDRVRGLVDFEKIEPREFWRRAVREALAETHYDPNPLIEAMFDPDGIGCGADSAEDTAFKHLRALQQRVRGESDGAVAAAAAVMLAVSLGYSPAAVIDSP
jgi:Fe-S-cluster containining protein